MSDYQPNLKSGLYEVKCLKAEVKTTQNTITKNESKRINFTFIPRLKYHPELSKSKFFTSQNIKTTVIETEKVIFKDNDFVSALYTLLDFTPKDYTLDEVCESLENEVMCIEINVLRPGDKEYYVSERGNGNPQIRVLKIIKSEYPLAKDEDLVVDFVDTNPELNF